MAQRRLSHESSSIPKAEDEHAKHQQAFVVMLNCGLKPRIIYRYVTREIAAPFFISLFVFTGILFLGRSLKLIDLVVNKNVPISDILLLFSYIIPRFLEIAIPMALLLSVIIAFGRLSSDSELAVIRSAGISLRRLSLPVFIFSLLSMFAAFLISFWLRPWAMHQLGLGMFEIARNQASAGLVAGVFNDLGQLTIYAESIENSGAELKKVLISDYRDPAANRNFVAKHGRVLSDKTARTLTLQLFDGIIEEGTGNNFSITEYEINNLILPHSELLDESADRGGKKSEEMLLGELLHAITAAEEKLSQLTESNSLKEQSFLLSRLRVELHKRFAIPFSCLAIALLAMALGIQPSRGGHTWGASASISFGILLILVYYGMFAAAAGLGEQGIVMPGVALWFPNFFFGLLGIWVFKQIGSEKWLAVSEALGDRLMWVFRSLRMSPSSDVNQT